MTNELDTLFSEYLDGKNSAATEILKQDNCILYLFEKLKGMDKRSAAGLLSKAAKKEIFRREIASLDSAEAVIQSLLKDADAKTRKNAAILLGTLGQRGYVPALIDALNAESQLYVRPSIILALGSIGGSEARKAIQSLPRPDGTGVHQKAEADAIDKALSRLAPEERRIFTGFYCARDVILIPVSGMVNILYREALENGIMLEKNQAHALTRTHDYDSLFKVRSFYEALLPFGHAVPFTPEHVANAVSSFGLFKELTSMHEGTGAFALRIEIKSAEPVDRGAFAKAFFPLLNPQEFYNSPSSYDIELRILVKNAAARLFVKLYTHDDDRFSYRLDSVPASIHPAAAAAALRIVRHRMGANSSVLDPFCGSGTMLVERAKITTAKALHGIDISPEACEIARGNIQAAGLEAKIYNRSALGFDAGAGYNEIYSNMPFGNRVGTHHSNEKLYEKFFKELPSMLKSGGFALLITNEKALLKSSASRAGIKIASETPFAYGGLSPSAFLIEKT